MQPLIKRDVLISLTSCSQSFQQVPNEPTSVCSERKSHTVWEQPLSPLSGGRERCDFLENLLNFLKNKIGKDYAVKKRKKRTFSTLWSCTLEPCA